MEDPMKVFELIGEHFPTGWETPEDEANFYHELTSTGRAVKQWTSHGTMRHVPSPEWMPSSPMTKD